MFCPGCQDEFRPGFTRCERCRMDLVEDLSTAKLATETPVVVAPPLQLRMAEYCGFFAYDEARHARDRLRRELIRCEIVVREPPDSALDAPIEEEFWLRVEAQKLQQAENLLGQDTAAASGGSAEGGEFNCSECGRTVAAAENSCPGCGARFED